MDMQFFYRANFISCIFYSVSLYNTFTITNIYIMIPGLAREVTDVIGACSHHIYEK